MKTNRKNVRKKSVKKKKRRLKSSVVVTAAFALILLFVHLFLLGRNNSLAAQNQQLANAIASNQEDIVALTEDINSLQNKHRVMGLLDNQVLDIQENIYVFDDDR